MPRILDQVADALDRAMVVGERRAKQLVYLVVTSRLLDRPVSAAVKGPSSAGKSYLVEQVLSLFPADSYYALSAMSEKSLAYSKEPLSHRILVLYEVAGLDSDFTSYLLRSLLSEGCLRYETVEKTKKGLESRLIVREGPTGLLTTTTAIRLHPENETRLLSIQIADTPAQTAAILLAQAEPSQPINVAPFHTLQQWLASSGERRVVVPFAIALARLIPPVAVRLRRDIAMVLSLMRAHALLHRATRPQSSDGAIEATLEDYDVVRELVADLVADGVAAAVSPTMRQTVQAVSAVLARGSGEVRVAAVARELGLEESSAYRRVNSAVNRGYLRNLEDKPRRPARLQLGEPLPDDQEVLPSRERLQDCIAARTQ